MTDRPKKENAKSSAGLPARQAALTLLVDALEKSIPPQENPKPLDGLEPRDKGFAWQLTFTCLRHLGQIDLLIKHFMPNKPPNSSRNAYHILRLAAAELVFMDAPAHAAVDSAVRLVKKDRGAARMSGVVNAVSRRLSEQGTTLLAEQDAERPSMAGWLWKRLNTTYGQKTTRAIAQAHISGPLLDIAVKAEPALWAEKIGGILTPSGAIRMPRGTDLTQCDGFETGDIWAQDAAAQIPARLMGDIIGKSVLDLCAAPGGKTMQLAAMGAEVTALDSSGKRLEKLRHNLKRTNLKSKVVVDDIMSWKCDEKFDAILLDAPCTATGTIRRHPELPWIKDDTQLNKITRVQLAMMLRAWGWLKPGGTLIYATCSLFPEEGENPVSRFLDIKKDAFRKPVTAAEVGGELMITADGDFRSLPSHWKDIGGIDGFFTARIVKKN